MIYVYNQWPVDDLLVFFLVNVFINYLTKSSNHNTIDWIFFTTFNFYNDNITHRNNDDLIFIENLSLYVK
jgi:hypothetical protein